MAEKPNKKDGAAILDHLKAFFRSPAFRRLYENTVKGTMPENLDVSYRNEDGRKPLPNNELLYVSETGSIYVDVSRATKLLATTGSLGRIDVKRLIPHIRGELEKLKVTTVKPVTGKGEFTVEELAKELESIKSIHLSLRYAKQEEVQGTINSFLRQDDQREVLQGYLDISEENKLYFMSILQKFAITVDFARQLPKLWAWIQNKINEQKRKVEFELYQCPDKRAVMEVVTTLRQNVRDGVFLGYFSYLDKDDLGEYFNALEQSELHKIRNMDLFREKKPLLAGLLKSTVEQPEDRTSLLEDYHELINDFNALLPDVKDKVIRSLAAAHCHMTEKVLEWKPPTWNNLDEATEFTRTLSKMARLFDDYSALIREKADKFTNAEYQSSWQRILTFSKNTGIKLNTMVRKQLEPALKGLVQRELCQVPFKNRRNLRLDYEELIHMITLFQHNESLFSEPVTSSLLDKLETSKKQLQREVLGYASMKFKRLPDLKKLALKKISLQDFTKTADNVSLAKKTAHSFRRKSITPKLIKSMVGTPIPKAVRPILAQMIALNKNITVLKNRFRTKHDLILDVLYKLLLLIDPGGRRFDTYVTRDGEGLRVKLISRKNNLKNQQLSLKWIDFQPIGPVTLMVKSTFFEKRYWIIKLLFPFAGSPHSGKRLKVDKSFMNSLPERVEKSIQEASLTEVRRDLETILPGTSGEIDNALSKTRWIETIIREQELRKSEKAVRQHLRAAAPQTFLNDLTTIQARIPNSVFEVLDQLASSPDEITIESLNKCLSFFSLNNFYFLPVPCRMRESSLQELLNSWTLKAANAALDDIYASFHGIVEILCKSFKQAFHENNLSTLSDSERKLFELLKKLTFHQHGEAAFLKMADLLSPDEHSRDLSYILNTIARGIIGKLDNEISEQIITLVHAIYGDLQHKEYEKHVFLHIEIAEALLAAITTLHENRFVYWNIKPTHILISKKGNDPVRITFCDYSNSVLGDSSVTPEQAGEDNSVVPSVMGHEGYLAPFWFLPERSGEVPFSLLKTGDIQMVAASIIELFTGKPVIHDRYVTKMRNTSKHAQDTTISSDEWIDTWLTLMKKGVREARKYVGELKWFQQLAQFIAKTEEIISREGRHPLLEHAPSLPYFIRAGEQSEMIIHYHRKRDEALLNLTQSQVERYIVEWLGNLVKRVNTRYSLVSILGKRLRWAHKNHYFEVVYSIIHYNPGKSIIVGLRFHWNAVKRRDTFTNTELVFSIRLDLYRTISHSIITRGLVDTKLRDEFVHYMQTEGLFKEKVPDLKDIIVFSCPDKYVEIMEHALKLDAQHDRELVNRLLTKQKGGIGISDVLRKYFFLPVDGREYIVQPYEFMKGQTLEAWLRRDETIDMERDLLKHVLEVFCEQTIPQCRKTSPELWEDHFQTLEEKDWIILDRYLKHYHFGRSSTLLKDEKIIRENFIDLILGMFWSLTDEESPIKLPGLDLDEQKQRQLLLHFVDQIRLKKHNDAEMIEQQREIVNKIILSRLALFYFNCRKYEVIHRDLKPANIMIKRSENPASPDSEVKVIDTEGTLWREGQKLKGFSPDVLISITPDYSSPYILKWLQKHSTMGDQYFKIYQEYDAFSMFIIFFELLYGRRELRSLANEVYDDYCLNISSFIRNPLYMGYLYARNEADVSNDYSKTDFIDTHHFEEIITIVQTDFDLECEPTLEALNQILGSEELYDQLRQKVSPQFHEQVDTLLQQSDLPDDLKIKRHNRFLLNMLYQKTCPNPEETRQSLMLKYKDILVQAPSLLDQAQEAYETLMQAMYDRLPDNRLKYTLFHWFLVPTGINSRLQLTRPHDKEYGDLQYFIVSEENKKTAMERTFKKIHGIKQNLKKKGFHILDHKGDVITDPKPISPLAAFKKLEQDILDSLTP